MFSVIPLIIWYWTKHLIVSQIKYYLWCWKWAKLFNRCGAIVHAVFQNTRKDNRVVFRCWGGVREEALSIYFHLTCCPHQRHPVNHTAPPRAISFGSQPPKFPWKPTQAGPLLPENCFTEGLSNVSHESQSLTTKQLSLQPHLLVVYWSIERKENVIKAWYVGGDGWGLLKMKGEVCWENTGHPEQAKSRGRPTVRWYLRRWPYFVSYCIRLFPPTLGVLTLKKMTILPCPSYTTSLKPCALS